MKQAIIFLLSVAFLCSCSPQIVTKGKQYAKLYEEDPVTIVVMPPINQTDFVDAKEYFYTTLHKPLCEKGYYVFSPYMTMEFFQSESAYDSEMFVENDLTIFKNVLGADAAMFTIIKSWKKNGLLGSITVGIEYRLRSTQSGETIYSREGLITVDTSVNSGTGGTFGFLTNAIATAINTAITDKIVAGRRCNAFVLSDMPHGKYSSQHKVDSEQAAGEKFVRATVKQ